MVNSANVGNRVELFIQHLVCLVKPSADDVVKCFSPFMPGVPRKKRTLANNVGRRTRRLIRVYTVCIKNRNFYKA